MVVVQNASIMSHGEASILDAYYDTRSGYSGIPGSFSISGYGGNLPVSIQNLPEEQAAGIYSSGDGSFSLVSYQQEKANGNISGLPGAAASIYVSRNLGLVFAANQISHVFTIADAQSSASMSFGLPGVYRASVNPGSSVAFAFVQNSNYFYYPRQLTNSQSLAYSTGPSSWPKAALDCEPQNLPGWCLFQAQSPDHIDSTGNYYGAPLVFDRPIKAVFSADATSAYILNCGPECGGSTASISIIPIAPLLYTAGQNSGLLPCNSAPCVNAAAKPMVTIPIPGGASNALVDTTTMYVVGQKAQSVGGQTYFGGSLSIVNLTTNAVSAPISISDGTPGGVSRIIKADDNTLWIGMTRCDTGVRFATGAAGGYGCLTMFDTSAKAVKLIEPFMGDATGIAAVTGLHKLYAVEGGQVYIFKTTDGTAINNQYVTVTGTAWDVAYMDATTDTNNTVY